MPELQIWTLSRQRKQDAPRSPVYLVDVCAKKTCDLVIRWCVALRIHDPQDGKPGRSLPRYSMRINNLINMHDRLTGGTPQASNIVLADLDLLRDVIILV